MELNISRKGKKEKQEIKKTELKIEKLVIKEIF